MFHAVVVSDSASPQLQGALVYYRDRIFNYPFTFTNALKHLGPIDTVLSALSYLHSALGQPEAVHTDTAENWLKHRFGTHLYNIFFASYCQKLWGKPASLLNADYAVFTVQHLSGSDTSAVWVADHLCDRAAITVTLQLHPSELFAPELFAAREMHIHSPCVHVSHIHPLPNQLAMTYFCDQTDDMWKLDDPALVQLAGQELTSLKLIPETPELIASGTVLRQDSLFTAQQPSLSAVNHYSAISEAV